MTMWNILKSCLYCVIIRLYNKLDAGCEKQPNLQTRFQKSWDTVQIVNKKECNNLQIS